MLKIIAVDKLRDDGIKKGIDVYLKRLNNRLKVEVVEITPAKYSTYDSVEKAVDKEGSKILETLNSQDFIVTLDEKGKQYTSVGFSELIYNTINHKHITFIIGGAYGLSDKIKERSNLVMCLSKMTFTHEMARLFLVEQVYRAYCIHGGIKYHH